MREGDPGNGGTNTPAWPKKGAWMGLSSVMSDILVG
jgi:hypothetical protein